MARRFVKDLLKGRELENLQEEIEGIVSKTTGGDMGKAPKMIHKRLFPPLDIHESDERFIIILDLSGFNQENINLEIDEDGERLRIEGNRETESYEGFELVEEGRVKSFKKSIELPEPVKTEEIKAEYSKGSLILKFEKAKISGGKTIEIQ